MELLSGATRGKDVLKNSKWIKINEYEEQLFQAASCLSSKYGSMVWKLFLQL